MTASVPFAAPVTPPLTGESTQATPRSPAAFATTLATLGPLVDRSINVFMREPLSTPVSPRHTAWTTEGIGRLRKTTSAFDATSSAEEALTAPRAVSGAIISGLVSKTTSECPASSRREAMGPPMRPTPTKPSVCDMAIDSSAPQCLGVPYSALNERIGNVGGRRNPDALHLQIFLDHLLTALAAKPGPLIPAKRRQIADSPIRVDPDGPRLELLRHGQGTPDVLRPHAGGQPVDHVVADGERVLIVLERNHGENRTKDLFLRNAHAVPHAREDRRLDEPAVAALGTGCAGSAPHWPRPLAPGDVDVLQDLLELRLVGDGADLRPRVHGIAHLRRFRECDKLFQELVMNAVLHQQS